MNVGLFDRAINCKLCRNVDKLWCNKHVALAYVTANK